MFGRSVKAALLAASVLLLPVAASASQFDYSSFAVDNGQSIQVFSPNFINADTGMIILNGTGPNAGQMLDAWCLDLFNTLATSADYNITPLTTAGSGNPNPALSTTQIQEIASLMYNGQQNVGALFDNSTAYQLAIWSVEYGSSLLDNANSTLATLVALLVTENSVGGSQYCATCTADLLDAPNSNQVLGFAVNATPLPGAVWLFAGGLGLIGWLTRKRKRPATAIGPLAA